MNSRHQRGVSAVAIVIVIAVVVVILVLILNSGVGPDGLTAHVDHYIRMLDNRAPAAPGARPTGLAVVVDSEMKRIDALHDRLPSAIRATKHSEVGTVIVLVRSGTGIGAGFTSGLSPATLQQGSYTISAFLFDKAGNPILNHSVTKKTSMSGAGAEAEAKGEADRDMLAWIQSQF